MKILAIVGTYRKGGIIDSAVDEILGSAAGQGAEVEKIYLVDKQIEFCTNCRACTQEPGDEPGTCIFDDDMRPILDAAAAADGIVLASPMNFGTATAVMKRFIERLVCLAYWPWGKMIPKPRHTRKSKAAVVVAASSAPSFLIRVMTQLVGLLKGAVGLLGARTKGLLFIGNAAGSRTPVLSDAARKKARRLGARLAACGTG
jgi:multimeric flavodoxin WrbA